MEVIVTNIVIVYNEIIKLLLFGNMFFKVEICERKRYIMYLLGGGIGAGLLAYLFEDSLVVRLDTILMIAIVYLIARNIKLIYIILEFCIVSLIDIIFSGILLSFLNMTAEEIVNNRNTNILVNSLLTLLLFLGWLYRRNKKQKKYSLILSTRSVFILIIGALSFAFYIAIAQVLGFDRGSSYQQRVAILAICIGGGLYFLALCGGTYVYTQNIKLVEEMALKEKFLNQQKLYYTLLLNKEEKTKRFRHDIRGHINSIRTLAVDRDFDGLNEYLDDLDGRLKDLHLQVYTGNSVVNAIVADMQSQYNNVSIEWNGKLSDDIQMRTIDLCIIFSNLLSNAFKAVNETLSPKVKVDIKVLESNVYVSIRNEIKDEVLIEKKKFVKKIHNEGHGYGLKNIVDCVESYSGIFEIHTEKKEFIAEIMIPKSV